MAQIQQKGVLRTVQASLLLHAHLRPGYAQKTAGGGHTKRTDALGGDGGQVLDSLHRRRLYVARRRPPHVL